MSEAIDRVNDTMQEEVRNFCDVSEENIIEGGHTRSQVRASNVVEHKKCYAVLKKVRRVLLKFKLAIQVKGKRGTNFKGYRSYKQAVVANPAWEDAYLREISKLEKLGGMTVVKREKWMKPLPFVEVLTEKVNNITGQLKLKVRLAVRGDLEVDKPANCYSPAAGTTEMRLFICMMKVLRCFVVQGDCPSAYLNGRLDKLIYLLLPSGHPQKDDANSKVYACPSSVYGLSVAGKVWYNKFVDVVAEFGSKPLQRAPTMFTVEKDGATAYLQLYVDLLRSRSSKLSDEVQEFLFKKFKVTCTAEINKFVGLEIDNRKEDLYLHQSGMIGDLGLKYRVEKGYSAPLQVHHK